MEKAELSYDQTVNPPLEALPNIYLERAGKGSRRLSEKLLENPEDPLNLEDVKLLQKFEVELIGKIVYEDKPTVDDEKEDVEDKKDEEESKELTLESLLKQHKGTAMQAPAFFSEAFLQGQVHLDGREGEMRQLHTPEDVYTWLAQHAKDETITAAQFREMAKQSTAFYKSEATQALLRGERPHASILDNMPIVIEPLKTLRFAEGAMTAREQLLMKRKQYGENATGLGGAKRSITDIYTKRVNGQVASNIPMLEYLVEQSRLIYDKETEVDAYQAMPKLLREFAIDKTKQILLYKRLDFLKNGIGYDENGHATAVDAEIFEATANAEATTETEPIFTVEQKQILKETLIPPEMMAELFSKVLEIAGLLSSESSDTWSPGRGHRAADDLFQVVMQPTKDSFAVNGIDGVFMISNKSRSLYDLLTVGAHELTHIDQTQADKIFEAMLKIGGMKGRRVSMIRETGANIVQRQFEKELFGQSKKVAFAYARAIQSLEAGGDMFDASQAFYEEKKRENPSEPASKLAEEAADRVLRLMLSGGTNSQPMSYAEENLMNLDLKDASPEVKQRATLLTSLDLDDQVRLHKYGLLPTIEGVSVDWPRILLEVMQPLIEESFNDYYDKDVEENKSIVLSYN